MGHSSTAVKKKDFKFGAHASVPKLILYKVTPFKIRDHFAPRDLNQFEKPPYRNVGLGRFYRGGVFEVGFL